MREIKFRSWAHASKVMFYPDEEDGSRLKSGRFIARPNTTVMLFTGYKDSIGNEVYEGDVFRFKPTAPGFPVEIITTVTWPFDPSMFECEGQVIGNIYENPDLISK